jgi:hypothetical protein
LTGIADGAFELRTLGDDAEPAPWSEHWDTPDRLPRLVRLQLRMQDDNDRWPTLVAAPRLGQTLQPSRNAGTPDAPEIDQDGQ